MRVFSIPLLALILLVQGLPAVAGETGGGGVTVWRGEPGSHRDTAEKPRFDDWIRDWRTRISTPISPISKETQKRFRHAFPAGLFDWAHFTILGDDRLWRQAAHRGYGGALLLVLDDLIVFRTADAARHHALWYEGLAEAQNFRRFGVARTVTPKPLGPKRHIGKRPQPYPGYDTRYLYPGWRLRGQGEVGNEQAQSPGQITVPGSIIVQPVNPFQNE